MPGAPAGTTRAPALASSPRVARASGLRDQDPASRADRAGQRHELHRGHGADGAESRRLDRGDRVLHPQLVRQSRVARRGRADVARVRAATASRKNKSWTTSELEASLPKLVLADGWKLSASHNPAIAVAGARHQSVDVRPRAAAGMWFQIELPQPAIADRDPVHVDGAGGRYDADRSWRADAYWHSRRPRCARCAAPAPPATRVPARVSGAGVDGRHHVGSSRSRAARGTGTLTDIVVRAGAREIRSHHPVRQPPTRRGPFSGCGSMSLAPQSLEPGEMLNVEC